MKEIILSIVELFNFHLVYATYGYLGNMQMAIHFAYSNGYLMWKLRPMLFYQARRRGIKTKDYAFTNGGEKNG